MKVDLLSGEYIVICVGDWVENIYDYNITLRGKELCKFERIRFGEFTLIASLLKEMSLKEGKTWKKNAVDHYILYHADSNMLIHTVKNPTSKTLYFSQKTAALDFTTLFLLSPAVPENQPKKKFRTEMQEIKEAEINSYEWEVPLEAGGTYTWVFATKNNFQVDHPKLWGFK